MYPGSVVSSPDHSRRAPNSLDIRETCLFLFPQALVSLLPSSFNLLRNSKCSIVIVVCLLKSYQIAKPGPQGLNLGTRLNR